MKNDEIVFLDGGGYLNISHYARVMFARAEKKLAIIHRPSHLEYLKMHEKAKSDDDLTRQIDRVYLSTKAELKVK